MQCGQGTGRFQEEVAVHHPETARIFEFQRLMLEDPTLVDAIEQKIRQTAWNASR